MILKNIVITIVPIVAVVIIAFLIIDDDNKKNRILDIEQRIEEIKHEVFESEKYISSEAFYECRKEIPRYSSGLVTAEEYYPIVNQCFEKKAQNETLKLEKLNEERQILNTELKMLTGI